MTDTASASPAAVSTPTTDDPFALDPILVEVVRNGTIESVHHGRVAVTGPDGGLTHELGAVFAPMYPRSSSKPLQAVGMVRAGLDLPPELLSLVCASHSGEPFQVEGVRRILTGAGLSEDDLQTPPDWPSDEQAAHDVIRAGGSQTAITMNCSGKHAGMLALCHTKGWPYEGYRLAEHPCQRAMLAEVAELAETSEMPTAVDGCGVVTFALPLERMAAAFTRVDERVAAAMRAQPELIRGHGALDTSLMLELPGWTAKGGAEGLLCAAGPDDLGLALKAEDGQQRALRPALGSFLGMLGLDGSGFGGVPIYNSRREVVGSVTSC